MVNTCVVPGCSSRSDRAKHLSFHALPLTNKPLLRQWVHQIGRKKLPINKNTRVCIVCILRYNFKAEVLTDLKSPTGRPSSAVLVTKQLIICAFVKVNISCGAEYALIMSFQPFVGRSESSTEDLCGQSGSTSCLSQPSLSMLTLACDQALLLTRQGVIERERSPRFSPFLRVQERGPGNEAMLTPNASREDHCML